MTYLGLQHCLTPDRTFNNFDPILVLYTQCWCSVTRKLKQHLTFPTHKIFHEKPDFRHHDQSPNSNSSNAKSHEFYSNVTGPAESIHYSRPWSVQWPPIYGQSFISITLVEPVIFPWRPIQMVEPILSSFQHLCINCFNSTVLRRSDQKLSKCCSNSLLWNVKTYLFKRPALVDWNSKEIE